MDFIKNYWLEFSSKLVIFLWIRDLQLAFWNIYFQAILENGCFSLPVIKFHESPFAIEDLYGFYVFSIAFIALSAFYLPHHRIVSATGKVLLNVHLTYAQISPHYTWYKTSLCSGQTRRRKTLFFLLPPRLNYKRKHFLRQFYFP